MVRVCPECDGLGVPLDAAPCRPVCDCCHGRRYIRDDDSPKVESISDVGAFAPLVSIAPRSSDIN